MERPTEQEVRDAEAVYNRCIAEGAPVPIKTLKTLVRAELLAIRGDGDLRKVGDTLYRWDGAKLKWVKDGGVDND